MKKSLLLLFMAVISFTMVACQENNETYIDENDQSYHLFYDGGDFFVYKLDNVTGIGTTDVIPIGTYEGVSYYFPSGTYVSYYLVVKDGVEKTLAGALQAQWFTLADMVTQFLPDEANAIDPEA